MGPVTVCVVSLEVPEGELDELAALLSEDERDRAARFRFPADRRRFVVSRARLRRLLGGQLGRDPREVRLARGHHGKPRLYPPEHELRFNMSRAHEVAVYAFARGREVGVDVERLRPLPGADAVAARILSPEERNKWAACAPHRRAAALLTAWTRKEAVLKASGEGLRRPPASVHTGLTAGPAVVSLAGPLRVPPRPGTPWSVGSLAVVPGHVAALAAEGLDGVAEVLVRAELVGS